MYGKIIRRREKYDTYEHVAGETMGRSMCFFLLFLKDTTAIFLVKTMKTYLIPNMSGKIVH